MEQSWSESVGTKVWRRDAERWIRDVLADRGVAVSGPIEQPRIRPWSTQLVVPTEAGRFWFKANCPSMAFEPRLQRVLGALIPEDVEAPYASEEGRGWMLTRDRGPSLGKRHEPTLADWQEVVSHAARIQRVLADSRQSLTDAGLPDCSPPTVPERLDRLVERFQDLPASHPSHVSVELAAKLDKSRTQVVEAAAQLAGSPVPSSLQHGDLHPWNVFVLDDGLRFFDFGDAQWAYALEVLSVPYGWIKARTVLPWEPVRDAYLEHWSDLVTPREFEALWCAAELTHSVNRSATWWSALQGAPPAEWAEWGDAPLAHLGNVLEGPR
ncbi:MAG: phosphotransferase [Aeromicrobium sp.]